MGTKDRVSAVTRWLAGRRLLSELGLLALTVLFGLQVLRVLVSALTWGLGDRLGLGAIQLGAIALLVFLTAFLAGRLRRLFGNHLVVAITAGGLGLLRLAMQIWWGEPLVNLGLAMAGTILFVLFLPSYLEKAQLRGGPAIGHFALGLLAGLALDTALHGAFSTYDISWQVGLMPVLLILVLVLLQWLLLISNKLATSLGGTGAPGTVTGGSTMKLLTWLAIGPFLFLQMVVFQNIARQAVLTDWPLPMAFGGTLLSQIAGLAVAVWLLRRKYRSLWPLALISGIGLVVTLGLPYPQTAWLTALALLVGQVLLSLLIVVVLIGIGAGFGKKSLSGITIASGLGMILLVIFLLGYYAVYEISLPYSNTLLEPIAALIVAICALVSSVGLRQGTMVINHRLWLVPGLVLCLLLLPLAGVISWRSPTAVAGDGFPIRIMSYNLHNGFNTDGHLDMEAIAQVIENSQADIVALQEVSRGWLVSGRLDMLTWLSQRLKMPYISGPTADPFWGNVILSRYPIVEYESYDLPPRDLTILRGFIAVRIELGNGDHLQVIATHYHHIEEDSDIRQLQTEAILDFWGGAGRTVLLGDLNAQPGDPEMGMLQQAGLVDALARIEPPPAYTYHSANLYERIDYIWVSPDLKVNDVWLLVSNASDHLPVVAVVE